VGAAPASLRFTRAPWSEASKHLARALRGADAALEAEASSGAVEVWRVEHGGGAPSWMVTRIEGAELVLVAYEGRELRQAARAVVAHARRKGFASIRFHAATPALARLVAEFRPVTVEIVSRVHLHGR
jgi:hypothetical protein